MLKSKQTNKKIIIVKNEKAATKNKQTKKRQKETKVKKKKKKETLTITTYKENKDSKTNLKVRMHKRVSPGVKTIVPHNRESPFHRHTRSKA